MVTDTFVELFSASESLNAAIKILSRISQNGVRRCHLSPGWFRLYDFR